MPFAFLAHSGQIQIPKVELHSPMGLILCIDILKNLPYSLCLDLDTSNQAISPAPWKPLHYAWTPWSPVGPALQWGHPSPHLGPDTHSGLPYQVGALSVSNKPSQLSFSCNVLLDMIKLQYFAWFTSLYCHSHHSSQALTLCASSSPYIVDSFLIPFKIQLLVLVTILGEYSFMMHGLWCCLLGCLLCGRLAH